MDDKYKQVVDNIIRTSKEHGYEPVPGRTLTPEEQRQLQQHSKDVYDFIKFNKEYQEESRKKSIRARTEITSLVA